MKTKKQKIIEKVSAKTALIATALIAIIVVVGLSGIIYAQKNVFENPVLLRIARVLHLPAIIVDSSETISFDTVAKNMAAMKRFYESQDYGQVGLRVDFSTEDGEKRLLVKERGILNKLLEDKAVERLATDRKITLTQKEIDVRVEEVIAETGNEKNIEDDLAEHYGMTMEDFKEYIVKPAVYQEKLLKEIEGEFIGDNEKAKESVEKALRELKDGADFGQVAKQYSQGNSASNGGEIGWVKRGDVIPQLADYIFSVKQPQELEIIESELGYHITQVLEKKKSDNEDVVKIRQIFIRKKGFSQWLDDEMKKMNVKVLLRGFAWDVNRQVIIFSDTDLEKFEREELQKFDGDASLL